MKAEIVLTYAYDAVNKHLQVSNSDLIRRVYVVTFGSRDGSKVLDSVFQSMLDLIVEIIESTIIKSKLSKLNGSIKRSTEPSQPFELASESKSVGITRSHTSTSEVRFHRGPTGL
jgi:hypothetical protein